MKVCCGSTVVPLFSYGIAFSQKVGNLNEME
jgi:hypothetical protein